MADVSAKPDYDGYDSQTFLIIVSRLSAKADKEISRASGLIAKIRSSDMKFASAEVSDYRTEITAVQKSRDRLLTLVELVADYQPVNVKELAARYEKFALALAKLEYYNERWEAILASDFIKKFVAALALVFLFRDAAKGRIKELETTMDKLEKALKKAEKKAWRKKVSGAIKLAWDVANILSPQLRTMNGIRKFAYDQAVSITADAITGKGPDPVGTAVGEMLGATKTEAQQAGFDKAVKSVKIAKKAFKADSLQKMVSGIKEAESTVDEISALLDKARSQSEGCKTWLTRSSGAAHRATVDAKRALGRLRAADSKLHDAEYHYRQIMALEKKR